MVRLPSENTNDTELKDAHISMAKALGQLMRQNTAGDRVIHVRDRAPADHETTRGFLSNSAMKLHTDGWDAAGLLCLQPAQNGGESLFARSQSVFERICELRPDIAPILLDDWYWDVRVLCDDASRPPLKSPIASLDSERLYCRYGSYILRNGAQAGGKELSAQRLELLDLFDEVTAEIELHRIITMARGDAIWINNRTILHGRKAFSDQGRTERNLIRLWIRMPNLRQPKKSFLDFDLECFGAD
ncbi:TauD/TfdA family dioxygenase [Roseivivax marinus]|uniref:TauD/TfdA family dioxygenase n=1 Tax=Roseivivax marinus TaxID=1379903 RepID=UPI0030B89699